MSSMMDQTHTAEHFSRIAPIFSERLWVKSHKFASNLLNHIEIASNELTLDVGLGTGNFQGILGIEKQKYYGIDFCPEMLEQAAKILPTNHLIIADAHRLPIGEKTFSLVCCRNLLKHCFVQTKVLEEMYRVCKLGGRVVIVESCALNELDREFMNRIISVTEPYQKPYLIPGEYLELFRQFNFSNISSHVFTNYEISTPEYRQKQLYLDDKKHELLWKIFSTASDEIKDIKKIRLFPDRAVHFLIYWILVEANK